MKNFDEERQARVDADRSFQIGGHQFVYRASVAPEAMLEWADYATAGDAELARLTNARQKLAFATARVNRTPPDSDLIERYEEAAMQLADEAAAAADAYNAARRTEQQWVAVMDSTIVSLLEPGQDELWEKVRSPDAELPISMQDLQALIEWLLEQISDRPTGPSSDSSSGAGDAKPDPVSAGGTDSTGDSSSTDTPEVSTVST